MLALRYYWRIISITNIWFGLIARNERFRFVTPRYFRYLAQTVYLTPLVIGLASAYLFAEVPQMQEIYLSIIENKDFERGLAGLAALSLFSAFLYAWNQAEVTKRIDEVYPDHADIHFDRRVFNVRDLKTLFAASLPFFGLFIGLAHVYRHVLDAKDGLTLSASLKQLPGLPDEVAFAALAALGVYLVLVVGLSIMRGTKSYKRLVYFCYALTFFLVITPILASNTTLLASRMAGPLASTAFVLIEAAVSVRILFWLLRKIFRLLLAVPSALMMLMDWMPLAARQAAIVVIPLALVSLAVANIVLNASARLEFQTTEAANAGPDDIGEKFKAWLAERRIGPGPYPVFIVAAQGGGIYAASTTAMFLATMQDHCPAFAKHIFAISAVSGGSVGAGLFDGAFADSIEHGTNRKASIDVEPGCDNVFAGDGELAKRVRAITEDDHISPVLAYLLPDLIGGFVPAGVRWRDRDPSQRRSCCEAPKFAWLGRDQILEKSFIESFERTSANVKKSSICPKNPDRAMLTKPFSAAWSETNDVPALLFNATLVENGFRVVFSPVRLGSFGGGTLYSFDELKLGMQAPDPAIIEAAVVSARFPLMMPPWVLNLQNGSRLSFVDGGYADSSGTVTGLQLYKKVKEVGGANIDLHLITLTDKLTPLHAYEAAGVRHSPVSGWLRDFFSPVTALLSTRDLQSRKAVREAHTELGERMIAVQLDQQAFPLPLGWQLSRLSHDIIRLTIGDPSNCVRSNEDASDTRVSIAQSNNCALKKIAQLLAPRTATSESLFPKPSPPKALGAWEPVAQ